MTAPAVDDLRAASDLSDVLGARVMPILRSHGGGVAVRSLRDGVLELEWQGACLGCPLRAMTVVAVLEPALLGIDGIDRIEAGVRLSAAARDRIRACAPRPEPRGTANACRW
jgi:Fe-S cluster biogenesis protein NfuA